MARGIVTMGDLQVWTNTRRFPSYLSIRQCPRTMFYKMRDRKLVRACVRFCLPSGDVSHMCSCSRRSPGAGRSTKRARLEPRAYEELPKKCEYGRRLGIFEVLRGVSGPAQPRSSDSWAGDGPFQCQELERMRRKGNPGWAPSWLPEPVSRTRRYRDTLPLPSTKR